MTTTADNEIDRLYAKATVLSLAPEHELELRAIAFHEAGHRFVAERLGIESAAFIAGPGAGVCAYADCGDPLKMAACAWGGVLAEALTRMPFRGRKLPAYGPTSANLYDWCREVPLHSLSQPDRDYIRGCDLFEGCKAAFDILAPNTEILDYLASTLCEKSRKRFAENSCRTERDLDFDLDTFSRDFQREQRSQAAERRTKEIQRDNDAVTPLPPCAVPEAFNFSTFLASTGATEAEARAFVEHRTQVAAWGVGRVATEDDIAVAAKFFREHQVGTRGMWVTMAKEFHSWRQQQTQIERSTNEH